MALGIFSLNTQKNLEELLEKLAIFFLPFLVFSFLTASYVCLHICFSRRDCFTALYGQAQSEQLIAVF